MAYNVKDYSYALGAAIRAAQEKNKAYEQGKTLNVSTNPADYKKTDQQAKATSTLATAYRNMSDEQRTALAHAVSSNRDKVLASAGADSLGDTAFFQYAQAIAELTREDGTVDYEPGKYKFNPYTDGRPDETAIKAYNSLSYKDQLLLDIGKNGKPTTPDFGDPNVDTSVYDRYQEALARVEAEEKAAAEEAKIKTQQEADDKAVKAIEDLYRNNRGNYVYDPTQDVKAIKGADKNITLTQDELKDIFEGLQSQYDWDDDAYNAWANPTTTATAEPTVAVEANDNKKSKAKSDLTLEQRIVQATTPENSDKVKAVADAQSTAVSSILTRWGKQYNQLTGNNDGEQKAKSQFATDTLNVYMSAMKGMMTAVGDIANAGAHVVKEANALFRKWVKGDDSEIKEGEFAQKYPITGYLLDAAFTVGDAGDSLEQKRSTYLKSTTGNTEASNAGKQVSNIAETLSNTATRALGTAALAATTPAQLIIYAAGAAGATYDELMESNTPKGKAAAMAAWNAVTEGIIERYTDKILLSGGKGMGSLLKGIANTGKMGALMQKGAAVMSTKYGAVALRLFDAGSSEGMEEFIQYYTGKLGEKIVFGAPTEPAKVQEALRQAGMGALCGTLFAGFGLVGDTVAGATAKAHTQKIAEDAITTGKMPDVEEAIQVTEEVANAVFEENPMTADELDTATAQGVVVPEKVKASYRQAERTEADAAQHEVSAREALKRAQAERPFGDPVRKQALDDYLDSLKSHKQATAKKEAEYAKVRAAIEENAAQLDAQIAQDQEANTQQEDLIAQHQFERNVKSDPAGMMEVLNGQEEVLAAELAAVEARLDQLPSASAEAKSLFTQVQQLSNAIVGIQQAKQYIEGAIAPKTAEDVTSEDGNTNTAPEAGESVRGDIETQAQGFVADMRQQGATTEQILAAVNEQASDVEATAEDAAFAEAVKAIVSGNTPSLAQHLITTNASTAKESTVTDLLNRARQEGTDEAGIALARELLVNTGAVDTSAQEIKTALRAMNIAPTAEERANIAATYGSYDAYRRAVAGVVPLGGENRANGVSIDQAIGALQQQFPGQVTGDDRTAWLYEFAQNNPKGRINYDGDLDADSAQLWGEIKADNASFFGSKDAAPSFAVPDFNNKETKYGKQAAVDWLDQTYKAGTADADIAAYAGTRKLTGTTAKERAFWENVEGAMAQARNGKTKVMAFKPTPQQETQGDVVKVLDETSPYMQADSTDMKHASSTYPTVRKLASIKNDIQNTLGFRYSDEHFIRAQRNAGAVAYYEPTGRFVVSDDTNNLPAFLHEAGHHMALDQYNEDEASAFKQNVPRKFLDEYPEGAQVQEAGAEMFRAWMMDPEFMERNYPETFEAMRKALGQSKYNRLRDESAAVRKWMDADVEKRVSSTQVTTREQEKARKKNFAWSDFIKKEADAEYGYKKLDRIMQRNGVTLAAGADARAACARTSSEAIHALMFDGMYDPKTGQKVAGSLTETTRGLIVTAEDKQTLEVYLELKQSLDRYEKNNKDWTFSKNVCTPAEAKAYVESVENNKKNVVDAAKNLWKWLEKYRHTQLSGAIPQSVIDEWDTLNPHYIPQTRVFTDNVRAAVRGSKTGDGTGVNRRKVGSTRDFLSPIDAIVQMVAKTKTAAMKHETLLALQEYYDAGEAYAGDFLHEVEPGVHITPVDGLTVTKAAVNALERGGMVAETLQQVNDLLDGNSPETRVYRYGAPNGRNNNIVAITQDGHTRYFEVRDQDLMDAIAPMNKQQLGSFLTAVSKVNRQISALITSKNPLFAGSNAIRDFVTGYAFGSTKNPIKYVGDYVSAARDVAKNTDAARQYRAMGGGGGLAQSFANADQVNDVTAAMFGRAGDDRNAVKRALDTVGNKLDEFNGGIETIPRLAEYKRQIEKGASYAEAIKAAKNLTTDFSTGGTHSKIMNTLWRFYGAQVNGLYKTFNLFADKNNTEQTKKDFNKTIGAISGIAVAGALWHFALHLLDDEDEYAALPDYIKDDYYIIPYGGGKFVRIPKPNDPLLVALDSMSRNLADVALRIQPGVDASDVVKEEGIDLLGDIASIVLPFGDWNKSNPLGSNFVGAPVMQWAYNKTWTGADIVPSYMEDVSPALQYDDKTSWVSRQLGKVFSISPMKLDNLFDQSSGVIGEVVDAFSAGVDAAEQGGIVKGVGAGLKEALLSRFLVDSAYSQNVTGGFYDAKDELTQFIEDVERNIDMENLPYSPMMKNLSPSETSTAYKEAKNMTKKINELSKTLSDIGKQATQYTQQGNDEKAREMKYKQQKLAAEASLIIADFFDKWKNQ